MHTHLGLLCLLNELTLLSLCNHHFFSGNVLCSEISLFNVNIACLAFFDYYLHDTSFSYLIFFFIVFFIASFFSKFIYFWLHWVFIAVCRLSLVVASRGYSSLRCVCFSLLWLFLLWSMGSRHVGFSSCGSWALALECRLSSYGVQA